MGRRDPGLRLQRQMHRRLAAVQPHLDPAVEPVRVSVEVDALVEIEVKVEVEVILLGGAVDLDVGPRGPAYPRLRERAVPLQSGAEVRILEVSVIRGEDEVLLVARAVRVATVVMRDGGGTGTGFRAVTDRLRLRERPTTHRLDDLQDLALFVGVRLFVDPVAGIVKRTT